MMSPEEMEREIKRLINRVEELENIVPPKEDRVKPIPERPKELST